MEEELLEKKKLLTVIWSALCGMTSATTSQMGPSTVSVKMFIAVVSTFRQTLSIRLNTDIPLNVCKEMELETEANS